MPLPPCRCRCCTPRRSAAAPYRPWRCWVRRAVSPSSTLPRSSPACGGSTDDSCAEGFRVDQDYARNLVAVSNQAVGTGVVSGFDADLIGAGDHRPRRGRARARAVGPGGPAALRDRSVDRRAGRAVDRSARPGRGVGGELARWRRGGSLRLRSVPTRRTVRVGPGSRPDRALRADGRGPQKRCAARRSGSASCAATRAPPTLTDQLRSRASGSGCVRSRWPCRRARGCRSPRCTCGRGSRRRTTRRNGARCRR